jgi:hypothetical protein
MKVTELKALAKQQGLRGYSQMRRQELIDTHAQHQTAAPQPMVQK